MITVRLGSGLLAGLLAALVTAFGGVETVRAHPHVFAKAKSAVVFKDGGIAGLRHTWTFDEEFIAGVMEEFDTDKDGKLSEKELGELVKLNMAALKDFGYFTVAHSGGKAVELAEGTDFRMWVAGKELQMVFTVGFRSVLSRGTELSFTVEDPTFFTHFTYEGVDSVVLGDGAPPGCTVRLKDRPARSEEEKKLVDAFSSGLGDVSGLLGNPHVALVRCAEGQ